jgi:transposase-like protein
LATKREFEDDVKLDVEARVRQGVKAVLEEVLEEEMTQHLQASYRELTPTRRAQRPLLPQPPHACRQDRAPGGAPR